MFFLYIALSDTSNISSFYVVLEDQSSRREFRHGIMTPQQVENRLQTAYSDSDISVVDLTGAHSYYEVNVACATFEEMSRVHLHQHVMALFQGELKTGEVHALSVKTKR